MTHKLLINKMKAHDWFYNFSDDPKAFQKGLGERQEILNLFCQIPVREIQALILEFVPQDCQHELVVALSHYNKSMNFLKGKI